MMLINMGRGVKGGSTNLKYLLLFFSYSFMLRLDLVGRMGSFWSSWLTFILLHPPTAIKEGEMGKIPSL